MDTILTAITYIGFIMIVINIQVVTPINFYMEIILKRKLNKWDIAPILIWICKIIAIYNLMFIYIN